MDVNQLYNMDSENQVCPVCTLFLRPGITLESHLKSHPKQKVIEALVRLSGSDQLPKIDLPQLPNTQIVASNSQNTTVNPQPWTPGNGTISMPINGNFPSVPGNHSAFIYQQIMSSTSTPQQGMINVNPVSNQQYVTIPAVFNPQMMCPPYVYQQQQVIIHRPLPLELPDSRCIETGPSFQNSGPIIIEHIDSDEPKTPVITEHKEVITIEEDNFNSQIPSPDKAPDESANITQQPEIDIEKATIIIEKEEEEEDDEKSTKFDEIEVGPSGVSYDEGFQGTVDEDESENLEKLKSDLNKACQTQIVGSRENSDSPEESLGGEPCNDDDSEKQDFFITPTPQPTYVTLENSYANQESPKPSYTNQVTTFTSPESAQSNDLSFMEMDGMNLVLANDYMPSNPVISQVEDYEFMQNRSERPRIFMTIGTTNGGTEIFMEHQQQDDRISETSGLHHTNSSYDEVDQQDQMKDDPNWNRSVQYHDSTSAMSTSYDLLARETWEEASDTSDNDMNNPSMQDTKLFNEDMKANIDIKESINLAQLKSTKDTLENDDIPTVSGYRDPPVMFKCSRCNISFKTFKERHQHHQEVHAVVDNEIGSKIGKKKVKKLVIKPKKTELSSENNFSDITNRLKMESIDIDLGLNRDSTITTDGLLTVDKKEETDTPVSCVFCSVLFPDAKALKQHKVEIHKIGTNIAPIKHKCMTCNEVFPSEPKFTEHLQIHPLECTICGKLFYRRQGMRLHLKRHSGEKPFKCSICDKSFLTKQKHDEHKNVHTGDAPIKCNMCDETFRRHSNLIQHRNRHHLNIKKKVKDFVCHCGEVFHSKKKLAWHKEIHDPKPKCCTHCTEKFIHTSSLTRHMRKSHNEHYVPNEEKNKENVECPICQGIYLKSSLETHLKSHSGVRPYTCLICNKDFTTKWNLKLHKWTHVSRAQKPFKCDLCEGAFIREPDFKAHMNSHKSVRPYTCNYCGAQFIRKYNCQRHVKEHEKGKTFTCTICNKNFHRSYYLSDHMRVHNGVRPYSCHICGKSSTTKSNHNKHVRIHHAREPVTTEN